MHSRPARISSLVYALSMMAIFSSTLLAAEPVVTVTDSSGQKITLKNAKWTLGTRKLAWLADPKNPSATPIALEFRETSSTTFQEGIVTLIPIQTIESIVYDYAKQTVTVTVNGLKEPLTGTTIYRGINQFGIDAEVDQGKTGVAVVKYRGGIAATGFQGVTITGSEAAKTATSKTNYKVIIQEAKAKTPELTVADLQPLYRLPDGSEQLIKTLPFEKTLKLPWSDVLGWKTEPAMEKNKAPEYIIRTTDGKSQNLTPMRLLEVDGKKANLLGLIGTVPAGFRLFPLHTIKELAIPKD